MRLSKILVAFALTAGILFVGSRLSIAAPLVGVVNVETILQKSVPAEAARKHLQQAKEILQKGMDDLEKEWKNAPEEERRRVLSEGLTALNRQMAIEENAANQVVLKIMQEECAKWRKDRKATMVIARQNILDADANVDITDTILKAMEKRVAHFADLPKVDVKDRKDVKKEEKKEDKKEEKSKKK